ncbi:MAG: hypothetical protein H0T79_06920 [Deltaproteobacteria bacterium]|nr:hypothetical protein [Deltaproteobacteria bacterium]
MNRFTQALVVLLGAWLGGACDDEVDVHAVRTCIDVGAFADECEAACAMAAVEYDYENPCTGTNGDEEVACRPTLDYEGHTGCCSPQDLGGGKTRYRFFECAPE